MSNNFDSLSSESKSFTIGEQSFELTPLGLEDIDLFMDLAEVSEDMKAFEVKDGEAKELTEEQKQKQKQIRKRQVNLLINIIRKTLLVSGASEEQIKRVSFKYFKELSKAVIEINGVNE